MVNQHIYIEMSDFPVQLNLAKPFVNDDDDDDGNGDGDGDDFFSKCTFTF